MVLRADKSDPYVELQGLQTAVFDIQQDPLACF